MKKKSICIVVIALTVSFTGPAFARGHSSGHSSSGHGRANTANGFMHKQCKTQACYKKHPEGSYAVPLRKKR